jgi:hypothetical protein
LYIILLHCITSSNTEPQPDAPQPWARTPWRGTGGIETRIFGVTIVTSTTTQFDPVPIVDFELVLHYDLWLHQYDLRHLIALVLPKCEGEPQLIAIPLAGTMGWVQSPPSFCVMSKTVCDLANQAICSNNTTPPHRLDEAAANVCTLWLISCSSIDGCPTHSHLENPTGPMKNGRCLQIWAEPVSINNSVCKHIWNKLTRWQLSAEDCIAFDQQAGGYVQQDANKNGGQWPTHEQLTRLATVSYNRFKSPGHWGIPTSKLKGYLNLLPEHGRDRVPSLLCVPW